MRHRVQIFQRVPPQVLQLELEATEVAHAVDCRGSKADDDKCSLGYGQTASVKTRATMSLAACPFPLRSSIGLSGAKTSP